jgi:hypothetical protein
VRSRDTAPHQAGPGANGDHRHEEGGGSTALERGWEPRRGDCSGVPVWVHPASGSATLERPTAGVVPPIPTGWLHVRTPTGQSLFVEPVSRRVAWDAPPCDDTSGEAGPNPRGGGGGGGAGGGGSGGGCDDDDNDREAAWAAAATAVGHEAWAAAAEPVGGAALDANHHRARGRPPAFVAGSQRIVSFEDIHSPERRRSSSGGGDDSNSSRSSTSAVARGRPWATAAAPPREEGMIATTENPLILGAAARSFDGAMPG